MSAIRNTENCVADCGHLFLPKTSLSGFKEVRGQGVGGLKNGDKRHIAGS